MPLEQHLDMQKIWLRVEAKRDGRSDDDFAKRLDVPRSTLVRWKNGERGLRIDSLVHIAHKLDMSLDFLVLGDSSDYTPYFLIEHLATRISDAVEEVRAIADTGRRLDLLRWDQTLIDEPDDEDPE